MYRFVTYPKFPPVLVTCFHISLECEQCTEVRFASFLSGGFTSMAVINRPERKLEKRTSVFVYIFKSVLVLFISHNDFRQSKSWQNQDVFGRFKFMISLNISLKAHCAIMLA